MRKSREETAESRRRILKAAAGLYREKGFDGVGVADIMEAAGMTHGGFYRHFPSKEALIAEAMASVIGERVDALEPGGDAALARSLREYVELYLSRAHVEHPAFGCPVAAVGSEVAHVGGDVSRVFADGVSRFVERVAAALDGPVETRRARAIRILTTMAGAVVAARAVGPLSGLQDEILQAAREDDEIAPLLRISGA